MAQRGIDPAEFARAFFGFLESMQCLAKPAQDTSPWDETSRAIKAHLGTENPHFSTFREKFDPEEHQALQLAFLAMSAPRPWAIIGLSALSHYNQLSISNVLRTHFGDDPSPPEYLNLSISADTTLPCITTSLHLAWLDDQPLVLLLKVGDGTTSHNRGISLEVMGVAEGTVRAFIATLRSHIRDLDVYRGKLLAYTFNQYGHSSLRHVQLPHLTRDDIVLPEAALTAMERHSVGISRKAEALKSAGQHLKRGLLLYGPPGTGKTHSVNYLCSRMPDRTTVLLSGPTSNALGRAVSIARNLAPATVVLEDVDLVAMDRSLPGHDTNPLLFQLLHEMDNLPADADILFVLTTNRPDLLEPALAARPGRVDLAIEIPLPDLHCRRRLLDIYLRGLAHRASDLDGLAERCHGCSPAFIKELVRRAVLNATHEADRPGTVDDTHLQGALDDLLHQDNPLHRSILGAPAGSP